MSVSTATPYPPSSAASAKYVPPAKRASWRQQSAQEPTTSFLLPASPSPSAHSSRRGSASSELSSPSCSSRSSSPSSSYSPSPPSGAASSKWRERANWRERAPRTPSPGRGAKPTFHDLRPGKVLHLPRKEEVPETSILHERMATRNDEPWNHPVVILEKKVSSDEMVLCQLMTSFRDGDAFAKKSEESKEKIALCENTCGVKAHQGLGGVYTRLLTFEQGSEKFNKPTYVNFYDSYGDGTFWIEYRHIQSWNTSSGRSIQITFDQESLERIKKQQVR